MAIAPTRLKHLPRPVAERDPPGHERIGDQIGADLVGAAMESDATVDLIHAGQAVSIAQRNAVANRLGTDFKTATLHIQATQDVLAASILQG